MLGSATPELEPFTWMSCPVCGIEGWSPVALPVVVCPSCSSLVGVDRRPAPPHFVPRDGVDPAGAPVTAPSPAKHTAGLVGVILFLGGIAAVFVGSGANIALVLGAPLVLAGVVFIGWWGERTDLSTPIDLRTRNGLPNPRIQEAEVVVIP